MKTLHAPWAREVTEVVELTETSLSNGLTREEASQRLKQHGQNIISDDNTKKPLTILVSQFKNTLIIILVLAVVVTISLSEWIDAIVISLAIIINTLLGFFQEHKAERAIADLKSYIQERVRVVRDGKETEISASLLVPGDVIHITHGARISADARLFKVTNFSVDESLLTGESLPEVKDHIPTLETTTLADRVGMVYAGTLAVDGSAFAIVTATAGNTEIGKLARLVSETISEKTPLQKAIAKLTIVIALATSVIVSIVFLIGIFQGQSIAEMLVLSIAIVVGAIPEALPIGLTAVLAVGVEQIAKKRGIMRSLTAAETLGSTTLIITDKTGTLTEANMKLVDINSQADLIKPDFKAGSANTYSTDQKELLMLALCATDVVIENPEANSTDWIISGSILEKNIVKAAGLIDVKLSSTDIAETQVVIPFSSRHKFSVNKITDKFLPERLSQFENPHVVLGAPDILLNLSYMDKETFIKTSEAINELSNQGRRVLGVALVTPKKSGNLNPEDIHDISFLGILCFFDPIRSDVKNALTKINDFGVKVVMATGDLPGTALAVAKDLGWSVTERSILTGDQIRQLDDQELLEALEYVQIFARVTPEDKLRITQSYQARGEIVAMTGDGVNDAPSLKAANIGIAVGSGSDVAKSIADLVLLDDSFGTIVATIEEGKRMLINIKKIFVYLMSNSLDEVILIGGAILVGISLPLSAIQIIWVNLFTGSIPAIAYAFDRQSVLRFDTGNNFFDKQVKFLTIGVGVLTSFLLLILYTALLKLGIELDLAKNILFACFGSYILVIAFSFKNLDLPIYKYSLTDNKVLLFGVGFGLILISASIYLPFLQSLIGTGPLPLPWLMFVVIWLLFNVLIVEIGKCFAYTYLKD